MLKDLSQAGRSAVRRAYWTSDEPAAAIARRYGVTPQEVEDLGQWRLFPVDEVPDWAFPGKPRGTRPRSILDLFALPPVNGAGAAAPPSAVREADAEAARRPAGAQEARFETERPAGARENGSETERPAGARALESETERLAADPHASGLEAERHPAERLARGGWPDPFSDADVVELRETYVEERGILDSMAEAFEIPRERVVRLLRGEERPEAGGPIYPDLDEAALTL